MAHYAAPRVYLVETDCRSDVGSAGTYSGESYTTNRSGSSTQNCSSQPRPPSTSSHCSPSSGDCGDTCDTDSSAPWLQPTRGNIHQNLPTFSVPPTELLVRISYDPQLYPLNELVGHVSGHNNGLQFLMRKLNKTVTLQWEKFSGKLSATGVGKITSTIPLPNPPPYELSFFIIVVVRGEERMGRLRVLPGQGTLATTNTYFEFILSSNPKEMNFDDMIEVPASTVTWIVNTH